MVQLVLPPDLVAWAREYLTGQFGEGGVQVVSMVPARYAGGPPLVVVRDDGGPQTSEVTFDRQLGVTVFAGSRDNPNVAQTVARRVYGLLTSPTVTTLPGSPVAAIIWESCNGPYLVNDRLDAGTCYMTIGYSVTGTW